MKPQNSSKSTKLVSTLFCPCTTVLLQWDFSHGKFGFLSLEKASCDSHATQPTVHAGCFSVSIIHRTLTWTTGSLTCAQMLMHAIAHGGVRTQVRESALKVDSGRKIARRAEESKPASAAWRSDGLTNWPTSPSSISCRRWTCRY